MKKILLAGLVCFASVGFVACSNGDYDANPNTNNSSVTNPLNNNGGGNNGGGNNSFNWTGTDPMSAKIDGESWVAEDASFIESNVGINAYLITGTKGINTMAIFLNKDIQAGNTYDLSPGQSNYTASYTVDYGNPSTIYTANIEGGKVKVLELDDTHIKGQFYFTGKQAPTFGTATKTIAEGYFNIQKD